MSILCSGLLNNAGLTKLSLTRCRIGDSGCDMLLGCLINNPKLCILNLTSCRLSNRSARCLALFLIRRKADLLQNIWEQSSQVSREENTDMMPRGLHTLILNQNPKLGDSGVKELSKALRSDSWMKSLSLRRCGITKYGAEIMIRVLYTNSVITKLDLTANHIPINTLQKVLRILKRRRETAATITSKRRYRFGTRRHIFQNIRRPINRGGKRTLNKKDSHNIYSSKYSQWKAMQKYGNGAKQSKEKVHEAKEDIYRRKKLSDLESQLFNLIESNFKLRDELSSNNALLNEQSEHRSKIEDELQKISLRLKDVRSKVVVLNCLSSKAYSESRLMQGLRYVFDKLESFSAMKQNTVEEEVILNNAEPLWSPSLTQQRGSSLVNCLQRRPYCPPLKI